MRRSRTKPTTILLTITAVLLALALGAYAYARSGLYNVGADEPHWGVTHAFLEQLREASIHERAEELEVPAGLTAPERVLQGAGNYAAMCAQCHLAPGMQPTELSRGLYPEPPNFSRERIPPAEAFWAIKHGIKASGMPAWGLSMEDVYIWNMAAFLQVLPGLDEQEYRSLVERSGGHSHGGGETGGAGHGDHHATPAASAGPAGHAHAPGTPAHDDGPGGAAAGDHHAAPAGPADDGGAAQPAHVDPPGAPPHEHPPAAGDHHH